MSDKLHLAGLALAALVILCATGLAAAHAIPSTVFGRLADFAMGGALGVTAPLLARGAQRPVDDPATTDPAPAPRGRRRQSEGVASG